MNADRLTQTAATLRGVYSAALVAALADALDDIVATHRPFSRRCCCDGACPELSRWKPLCDLVLGPEELGVMGLVVDVARRAAEERIEK